MMAKIYVSFCLSMYSLALVDSVRILGIYPVPFHSHQSVFQVLTEELAKNGHELVILTPLPHKYKIENVTEIDVHDVSFRIWEEKTAEAMKDQKRFSMSPIFFWEKIVHPAIYPIVDAQFSVPEMQKILNDKNQNFDVILSEACVPISVMVSARFKAPVIQVSSFFGSEDNFANVGATRHPLLFPEYNLQKIWKLSLWDKLVAAYTVIKLRMLERHIQQLENSIIRKHFGNDAPSISELKKNVQMLFMNVHHIWDNNRPVPPAVLYMGALHLREPKPIQEDLRKYLDASNNGVIYLSLGSKVKFSDIPTATLKIFFNVFASLPYNFLVKWNGETYPDIPDNVKLENWLPQNNLLHHPNIKAFITQGGLQSTDEAIAARVPLIGLPVLADQYYNAQKYVQHGIGIELSWDTLSEDALQQAIIDAVEDESYRTNISRLSVIMEEQRAGGIQKAVYWVEYIAKHGASHLRSPLADVTITEYLMLDVIGSFVFIFIVILSIPFVCVKVLSRFLNSKLKPRKVKSN